MAKDGTNSNCIKYWPNLEPMRVTLYLAGEITQVKESIPGVRCASGNVLLIVANIDNLPIIRRGQGVLQQRAEGKVKKNMCPSKLLIPRSTFLK